MLGSSWVAAQLGTSGDELRFMELAVYNVPPTLTFNYCVFFHIVRVYVYCMFLRMYSDYFPKHFLFGRVCIQKEHIFCGIGTEVLNVT
jgi:hypothetical protein